MFSSIKKTLASIFFSLFLWFSGYLEDDFIEEVLLQGKDYERRELLENPLHDVGEYRALFHDGMLMVSKISDDQTFFILKTEPVSLEIVDLLIQAYFLGLGDSKEERI